MPASTSAARRISRTLEYSSGTPSALARACASSRSSSAKALLKGARAGTAVTVVPGAVRSRRHSPRDHQHTSQNHQQKNDQRRPAWRSDVSQRANVLELGASCRRQTGNGDRDWLVDQGIDGLVALRTVQQCQGRHRLVAESVEREAHRAVKGSLAIGAQGVSSQVLHAVGWGNQWAGNPVNQLLSGIEAGGDVRYHGIAEKHSARPDAHGQRLSLSRPGGISDKNPRDQHHAQHVQAVRRFRRPKKAASGSE